MKTVLVVVISVGVIMQLVAILAWRIESQNNDTSALQRCAAKVNKSLAQIDRALGVVLMQWARYSEQYGWIVAKRVFMLFVWGVAAAALATLGRETDDWQLRVTSSVLFGLHGIACAESFRAVQEHFLSRVNAPNGSRPRVAILTRILGFLISILVLLWMVNVFSKMIQTTIA